MTFNVGDQVVWVAEDLTGVRQGKIYTLDSVSKSSGSIKFSDDNGATRFRCSDEVRLYKTAAQVAAEAAAAERKPWEVLREAADILEGKSHPITADIARGVANYIEEEANVPDPIEVLRRYDAAMFNVWGGLEYCIGQPATDIWRDVKRILAAHDKQKKEV